MPIAFLVIFGGALLVYMGWKNESFQGILNDTLDPISRPTGSQSDLTVAETQGISSATQSAISNPLSPFVPGVGSPFAAGKGYFSQWNIGRTDQGVDITPKPPLSTGAPLPAIGTSTVKGIIPNWYKGQPLVWLQAHDGPLAGRDYYYAEQITGIKPVGSIIPNGQPVGVYAASGTGIETGLATASGQTLARATTGYQEGIATPAGNLFKRLLGL